MSPVRLSARCSEGEPEAWTYRHGGRAEGLRCVAGGFTAQPFAARRVPCGARADGPRHNSLRGLRPLRSDRCRESVHEARCARAHAPCAPRLRTGAPGHTAQALGHEVPARHRWNAKHACVRAVPLPLGAHVRRRGAQGAGRRAQRASTTDSRHLFERNARSACSELCRAPCPRAPQGSPRAARTAAVAPPRAGASP